jgi:hypothetical protein
MLLLLHLQLIEIRSPLLSLHAGDPLPPDRDTKSQ